MSPLSLSNTGSAGFKDMYLQDRSNDLGYAHSFDTRSTSVSTIRFPQREVDNGVRGDDCGSVERSSVNVKPIQPFTPFSEVRVYYMKR